MGGKLILLLITNFLFTNFLFAQNDLYDLWIDQGKQPKYEFIQGFNPNKGVVIIYDNNAISEIKSFTLDANKITISYETYEYSIKGKKLLLNNYGEIKTFSRDVKKEKLKLIDFKRNNKLFIQNMLSASWKSSSQSYLFIPGFSNNTGIYHIIEEEETKTIETWGSANDILKLGDSTYIEGKISKKYIMLLSDDEEILFLNRGEKRKPLEKIELKESKEKFVPELISGRWIIPEYGEKTYYKFRPIFGDLSGLRFSYDNTQKYTTASKWEYSPETGEIIIDDYNKYKNAQIKGNYLLLLSEDDKVKAYERPKEDIKKFSFSDLNTIKVSEKNTSDLKKLIERQWFRYGEFYQFVFEDARTGYFHKFSTKPFSITGNKLQLGSDEYEDVKFMDNMLVLGKSSGNTFEVDTNIVFLEHVSTAQAQAKAKEIKESSKDLTKKKVYINLVLQDGSVKKVDLPIDSMSSIAEITIKEGL